MSNYLKMEKKNLIIALNTLGWSFRRIERETGVRRETISKYVNLHDSKAAISPTGSPQQSNSQRIHSIHGISKDVSGISIHSGREIEAEHRFGAGIDGFYNFL